MFSTFRYRFYPTREQAQILEETLRLCCLLYNAALEQRRFAREFGQPINYRIQQNQLPEMKKGMPEYTSVHSQVLQNVLLRVDGAFRNFFVRCAKRKIGQKIKAGFPRFKHLWRYNSLTYPQAKGFDIIDGQIRLPKIGRLRVFMHREPRGEIKTVTIKRDRVGDWFLMLATESLDFPTKTPESALGIDVGLNKLIQATNGEFVKAPMFYRKSEMKLKRAHKRLSRKQMGSKNRAKARVRLAIAHRKIQRQREDFLHKVSKILVKKADLLVFEGLQIQNMMKNRSLAKSIADASWGKLIQYASYKASKAGKSIVKVDPRGTTADCACGATVNISLSERTFKCPKCGLTLDRDLHGSFSILRKIGWEAAEYTPVEMRPLLDNQQVSSGKQEALPSSGGEDVTRYATVERGYLLEKVLPRSNLSRLKIDTS